VLLLPLWETGDVWFGKAVCMSACTNHYVCTFSLYFIDSAIRRLIFVHTRAHEATFHGECRLQSVGGCEWLHRGMQHDTRLLHTQYYPLPYRDHDSCARIRAPARACLVAPRKGYRSREVVERGGRELFKGEVSCQKAVEI
jgi:hypothetical protein